MVEHLSPGAGLAEVDHCSPDNIPFEVELGFLHQQLEASLWINGWTDCRSKSLGRSVGRGRARFLELGRADQVSALTSRGLRG